MERHLLILGAGGHGRVVADIARRQNSYRVLGFLDDNRTGEVNGLPCLGPISRLTDFAKDFHSTLSIVVGIGNNSVRKQLVLRLSTVVAMYEVSYATLIDPSAVVSAHADVGVGTVVMPNAVVNANASLGNHVIINTAATVDHDCVLGDFVHLSPGVHLAGDVFVGEGTQLGVGAVAIPGIRIGAWSLIGAGSVVVRDVPEGVTAYGVPCRVRS